MSACTWLGNQLIEDDSIARDNAQGVALLAKGCQLGDMRGCTMVAYLYCQGEAIGRSLERARQYYAYACHEGEATACSYLGLAYIAGDGGAKDDTRAITLLTRALQLDPNTPSAAEAAKALAISRDVIASTVTTR